MRSISLFAGFILFFAVLAQPGTAQAQSWKPICVNGGATAGAHNGTWQKVNTTGTGGATWKKAGGCVTPPPPPVVQPPPTEPPPPAGEPCLPDDEWYKPGFAQTNDPVRQVPGRIKEDVCYAKYGQPQGNWVVEPITLATKNVCENGRKVKKVVYLDAACGDYVFLSTRVATESRTVGNVDHLREQIRAYESVVQGERPLTEAEILDALNQ